MGAYQQVFNREGKEMSWFSKDEEGKEQRNLAKEVAIELDRKKAAKGGLSNADLLAEIAKLQAEVQKVKHQGVNVWNYKDALPKIFDIVDGAFEVMIEVVKNQEEKK